MRHNIVPTIGRALSAAAVTVTALSILAVPAWAVTSSTAKVAQPGGTAPLNGGGSQTLFALRLPVGARCAGDTAHQGYREWSYLVPKGTNLSTISFKGLLPQPGLGFDAHGEFFGPAFTEPTTAAVRLVEAFSFARWTRADLLPTGGNSSVWEGGVACATPKGDMSAYWDAEFTFTATASDPLGFTWIVSQRAVTSRSSSGWATPLLAGILVVAAAVAARVLWPRSRRKVDAAGANGDRETRTEQRT